MKITKGYKRFRTEYLDRRQMTHKNHQHMQDHIERSLEKDSARNLIDHAVDFRVITGLDHTIKDIEVKYNAKGGQVWISTYTRNITSIINGEERTKFDESLHEDAQDTIDRMADQLEQIWRSNQ